MTTKQQSKPLNIPTTKNKKLSSIESKLLECCENRQPILLYGQELSTDDHKDLINMVREVYVRVEKIKDYYDSRYVDCEFKNGKGVYEELVGQIGHDGDLLRDGVLFRCDGLIFPHNLHCRNDEDSENYIKLAKIINEHNNTSESPRGGMHKYENGKHLTVGYFSRNRFISLPLPTIFKWLVAYTYNDLKNFPKLFLRQFKQIPLDGKETIVKPSGATIESEVERQGVKAEKSLPKEKPGGKYVFRKEDEFYFIRYEDESFRLKAMAGWEYIQPLLEYYSIHCVPAGFIPRKLHATAKKSPSLPVGDPQDATYNAIFHQDLTLANHGEHANIVDDKTREIIKDLFDKREIAKATRDELAAKALEHQIEDLRNEYLCRGQQFKFVDLSHKRPYDAIRKAIIRALDKIYKTSNKKGYINKLTWKHLSNSIQFKDSCFFYKPEKPTRWEF